jgi:hypothetical protein
MGLAKISFKLVFNLIYFHSISVTFHDSQFIPHVMLMPFAEPGSGRWCLRQWLARCIAQHQAFAQSGHGAGQKTLQGNRWEIHGLESGILLFGMYQRSEHSPYINVVNTLRIFIALFLTNTNL